MTLSMTFVVDVGIIIIMTLSMTFVVDVGIIIIATKRYHLRLL